MTGIPLLVKMEVADQKVREETKVLNKLELLLSKTIVCHIAQLQHNVSESMVYRILTEDLEKRWVLTKWEFCCT